MKNDRTTAQQLLPEHTPSPETYMVSRGADEGPSLEQGTGGQFSLIEGLMPSGGDGGLHLHANEDESMHLLSGELEVTIGDKKFLLLQVKALRSQEYPAPSAEPE